MAGSSCCDPLECLQGSLLLWLLLLGLLLQFVVSQGGLDGVFCQHGAVQFHRRQAELLGDVGVFDGQGVLHLKCGGVKYSFSELDLAERGQNTPQDRLSEGTPAT